jgi:hypothetical protein
MENMTKPEIVIAVIGSRSLHIDVGAFINHPGRIGGIVSGGASGIDKMAEKYARENDIPIRVINADWDSIGKRAGYVRNQQVIKSADAVLAIWDGSSKGTAHAIDLARSCGKPIRLVIIKEENEPNF